MDIPKDIPQYNTVYVDKVLKEAREDEVTGNHLLLESLTRIFKQKRKEKANANPRENT